jgi:hypothetical protein
MRRGHLLAVLALTACSASGFAFAQQPGHSKMTCTNIQTGIATTITRCQGGSAVDSVLPKSGGTTDPAAAGKPYGAWGSSFGGQRWEGLGR